MKFRSVLLCFFLFAVVKNAGAQAPGCPDVDAGPDQNLNCTTNCTNLTATIFQSGATTDYSVSSIAYAPPYPFTGGTRVFINVDDEWTNTINLPFNFCFYGNQYNRIIIGTNGVLSFDVSMANNFCAWSYTASIPTPGPPPGGIYNNSINGAYHDIDPNVAVLGTSFPFLPTYPSNINYAVLGTAPCRTFVVNFSTVRHYSCNSLETTQQIVLYETTNAIEVYIKDKPTCTSWNSGNAVIGLQNIDGTKGITPPNRNTGPWSTNNEAWRFTPSGTPNWTLTWYDAANNALGNTPTISVCPTGTSTYRVEGVYQACDGSTVVVQDQVTINIAGGFTSSFTKTDEGCVTCSGTIDVSVSGGTPPFTFNLGSGAQASGSFTALCAGTYTVTVQDAANCSGTITTTITPALGLTVAAVATDESCPGANDGTITFTPTGGASPYTYSIGSGTQSTGIFTGLAAGNYSYTVVDVAGCSFSAIVPVGTGVCCTMTNTVASSNISCNAACDGTITLTENLGIAPVQFSIDNGANFQSSGNFTGLCAGTYSILIEDAGGCQFTSTVVLTEPAAIIVASTNVSATCGCDGSVTVTSASGGAGAPFQYSIDNGAFQSATAFAAVCPGNHTITARDADGCTGTTTTIVANTGGLAITNIVSINPSCNLICDASITISATGAVDYSIDNGATFQVANNFSSLCAGVYNIVVTDGGICQITDVVTITDPATISLSAAASYVQCFGDCNGIIDNIATGGTQPYQFSIDNGVNFQASNQFAALCPGTYSFLVSDANNCTATATTSVIEPIELSVSFNPTDATCPQLCNGIVDIFAAGGVTPYSYSLPGTTPTNSSPITGLCAGDFELTVTDANSCTVTSNFTISEPIGITISAGADDSVRIGESITLIPTFSDLNLVNTVSWSPPTGLSCTACTNPAASPLTSTIYTMTVEDINNCAYTDAVEVIVFSNPLVNIPNAFTPNGDGLNDIFLITGWEIDKFRMYVFNRWGEKVFETDNLSTGWDGSYSGKTLPPDVYVYLVDVTYLTGDKDIFKGSLTLLK